MPPDASSEQAIVAALERARRRAALRHAVQGLAAVSLAVAALAFVVPRSGWLIAALGAIAIAVVVAFVQSRRTVRTPRALAAALESRYPRLHNVVVTAEELLRHPERAPARVRARVFSDAAAALAAIDLDAPWPVRRLTIGAVAGLAIAAGSFLFAPVPQARAGESITPPGAVADGDVAVEVELMPPSYTRRPSVRIQNPDRIEALEGTVARLSVTNAPEVRLRFGGRALEAARSGAASSAIETLTESGYFAIDGADEGGTARLITVTVVPDRSPVVRVDRPARDLLLPDSRSSVDVTASATDDMALAALTLRYTKVSGAGEQIEFVEGELPLNIDRESEQRWRARGAIALPALKLEAGDSLVYRFVARDSRPGEAGTAASDTYFIEIAGPGQVPLEGVEMPPDQERYALSQQMVVLKIKRLREREPKLAPATLAEEASGIAGEQRSVRANFVFLMGGEVEDEDVEAEQSNEIQEGRLENTSRRELSRAVAHMTTAEQGLTAGDTAAALRAASHAVDALQRAFGRSRYLLRSLASRTKLDPSRRLTGVRDDVERGERTLAPAVPDAESQRARNLLVRFLQSMANTQPAGSKQLLAPLSEIGEAVLAVKPADSAWQEASSAVIRLRDRLASGAEGAQVRDGVSEVVRRLTALGRRSTAMVNPQRRELQRIESAMTPGGRRR